MTHNDKPMSEQESLALITEMIQKARGQYHQSGSSAILWGSLVSFCGLVSFAQRYWHFDIGFDIWLLGLVALVPQLWIAFRDKKHKVVKSHQENAMDAIWVVYGISIFAMIFYMNVIPHTSLKLFASDGIELLQKNTTTGIVTPYKPYVLSTSSLLILLYAIPTLATGIGQKFAPMIIGAVLCYGFFVVSCFTSSTWDALLNGLAAIFNWLIPGLILRKRYLKAKKANNV